LEETPHGLSAEHKWLARPKSELQCQGQEIMAFDDNFDSIFVHRTSHPAFHRASFCRPLTTLIPGEKGASPWPGSLPGTNLIESTSSVIERIGIS
jgi:hypothetical protein